MTKCRISKYATQRPNGTLTYGFRCATCGVATTRYSTPEVRDDRLRRHRKNAKRKRKTP